jgi:hypothetical protein
MSLEYVEYVTWMVFQRGWKPTRIRTSPWKSRTRDRITFWHPRSLGTVWYRTLLGLEAAHHQDSKAVPRAKKSPCPPYILILDQLRTGRDILLICRHQWGCRLAIWSLFVAGSLKIGRDMRCEPGKNMA